MNKRFTKLIAAFALLVFMTPSLAGWGQTRDVKTYTLTITADDFNTTSYAANNGEHTSTATATDGSTLQIIWTSNQVMKNGNNMQWQKNNGCIYNNTDLGTIQSVTVTSTAGSFTTYYGTTQQPTTETEVGNGFFQTKVGNATGTSSSLEVVFEKDASVAPTTYNVNLTQTTGGIISASATQAVAGATITLSATPDEGYSFVSWSIEPSTVTISDNQFTMPASNVTISASWTENTTPSGEWNWVLTNLADLTSSDVFVIVGNNNSDYAMTNNNGTGSAPAASAVTVENDMITSSVADNIQWTISGNATDGYTFYPNGDSEKWLYATNTNNGVRVGTNDNKIFEIKDGYLYNKGTSRYVGLYTANGASAPQDWRCYTSINSNISGQSFAFYKKVDANAPVISADNLELAYNATTGSINYEITNMVEGGVLSVTNTADWITNVVYTTSASGTITFDVAENPNATSRSTNILLQYVYGNNQMVNATVTVTQAGNPEIPMTIAEVRAQETGDVMTVGFVTSCVGTTGYIQDATAAICVYGRELTVGDEIRVSGTLTTYKGLLEIASPEVTVLSSGNTINPELMTIAQINASTNQGWYVRIQEATVQVIDNNNNYTIAQGENTITLHGELGVEVAVNDIISLNGNIGCFNTVQIVNPQNVEVQAAPVVPSINVTPELVEVDAAEHEGTLGLAYENLEISDMNDFIVVYFDNQGGSIDDPDWIEVSVAEQDSQIGEGYVVSYYMLENEGEARSAFFKVIAADGEDFVYSNLVTVNQAAYVAPFEPATYTLATSIESGKTYIIVNPESSKAMGAQNENNRAAADVTIQDQTITVTSDAVYEFVIESVSEGIYCIYDGRAAGFLYAASSSSNYLRTKAELDDNGKWAISFNQDGVASIVAQGGYTRNVMQYNSGSTLFSCYGSASQKPVYLYVKEEETPEHETYELTINGYTDAESKAGYYLIASPVTVNIADVDGLTEGDFDLYSYDESQELEWINYKQEDGSHPFTTLEPGKGYLYAKKATAETSTYTFTLMGTPYCGTPIVLSKQSTGTLAGWNLIGNPSATSNIAPDRAFYIMNSTIGELIASESSTVEPMQGFFVIADEDGEEFEWTAPLDCNLGKVVMNLTRNRGTVIDRAIVRFGEGQQLPKFQLNPNNTKLYIAQGEKDYAIVRSAAQGEMPVSFRASENGTYTIAVEAENVDMNYLHLIDNMTGMDVDLLVTPNYTFEAKTSDYVSRFRLVFSANGIDEQNAETFAFFNGSEWMVSNLGEATLQVVDVMGRVLSTETISGNAELSLDQPAGVYMLRLINGNDVKVQKVIVK